MSFYTFVEKTIYAFYKIPHTQNFWVIRVQKI
jgi:hypothetical protein